MIVSAWLVSSLRGDGFGRWWFVSKSTVRTNRVVVFSPLLDDDLGFFESAEDFAIEKLISEARIEAFAISILLRASRFDVSGL